MFLNNYKDSIDVFIYFGFSGVRFIKGTLLIVIEAREKGFLEFILPRQNTCMVYRSLCCTRLFENDYRKV
jgi:hypothetical protein